MSPGPGHNGGPALDAPADTRPGLCKHCRHWKALSEEEQRAYELFHLGLSASASGGRPAPATAS